MLKYSMTISTLYKFMKIDFLLIFFLMYSTILSFSNKKILHNNFFVKSEFLKLRSTVNWSSGIVSGSLLTCSTHPAASWALAQVLGCRKIELKESARFSNWGAGTPLVPCMRATWRLLCTSSSSSSVAIRDWNIKGQRNIEIQLKNNWTRLFYFIFFSVVQYLKLNLHFISYIIS